MEQTVTALSVGLRDCLKPTLCAACLLCVFEQVRGEGQSHQPKLRNLRSNHHEFWHGIMRFLAVRRTAESRGALRLLLESNLAACRSQDKGHASAFRTIGEGDHVVYMVVNMFFTMVDECLAQSDYKVVKLRKFNTRGLWPSSTDDLLPTGPEESFSALLHWIVVRPDAALQTSFQHIYMACRPELEPYLLMDGNRRLFVQTIVKQINVMADWLEETPQSERFTNMNNFGPAMICDSLAGLLLFAIVDPDANVSRVPRLGEPNQVVCGMEDGLIKGFEKAYRLFRDGLEKTKIADVLTILYDSRGTPLARRPADLQNPFAHKQKMTGNAAEIFQRQIRLRRDSHACGAAGCSVHERDIRRRLQRCAGCSVLQYCSRECQKRDWKDVKNPHKDVCAQLKSLSPFLDRDGDGFAAALEELQMAVPERAAIYVNIVNGDIPGSRGISTQEQIEQTVLIMNIHESTLREGGELGRSVLVQAFRALGASA